MSNCPVCNARPYLYFNWANAIKRKDKELAKLVNHLKPVRQLKFGHLYKCPTSENYWFLDDDKELMQFVSQDDIDIFWQWDRESYPLSADQKKILSKIKATESDIYGNGRGKVKIPCAIKRETGDFFDPVIIIITKMPPLQNNEKKTLFGNTADIILPSCYALPIEVRIASLNAKEQSMGFAPTLIKSNDDQYFILNWAAQLFSYGDVKGNDITLPKEQISSHKCNQFPMVHNYLDHSILHFDWYNGCRKLVPKKA